MPGNSTLHAAIHMNTLEQLKLALAPLLVFAFLRLYSYEQEQHPITFCLKLS